MPPVSLVAGLGNPGSRYAKHRHNIGFMLADCLAKHYGCSGWREKYTALIADGRIMDTHITLIKPQTFMNRCGLPLAQLLRFTKTETRQLVVVHDELDLPPGKIRVKRGGGSGGHNGLKDIDRHIGADYWRVRIGIGRPDIAQEADRHVLANFAKTDYAWLTPLLAALVTHWGLLYTGADDESASRFMNAIALAQQETTT